MNKRLANPLHTPTSYNIRITEAGSNNMNTIDDMKPVEAELRFPTITGQLVVCANITELFGIMLVECLMLPLTIIGPVNVK